MRVPSSFLIGLRLCGIEIGANKKRTVITSLGIFLGAGSLLVNLAFVRAMDREAHSSMERIGGLNVITARTLTPRTEREKIRFSRYPGFSPAEIRTICESVPYLAGAVQRADMRRPAFAGGGREERGRLLAVNDIFLRAYNYSIDAGREISVAEFARGSQVCIIGRQLADRLFGKGAEVVGKQITVHSMPLTIVGTIKTHSLLTSRASERLIPHALYRQRFGSPSGRVNETAFLLRNAQEADAARRMITDRITTLHRGVVGFEVVTNQEKIRDMRIAAQGMKVLLWSICAISLLVGGVSIMNIMFATVGDRIREIGIRKALGARRGDILLQFLLEATAVTLAGALPGLAVGALVTVLPHDALPFVATLTGFDYLPAFVFTLFAGILSGLFPALRAADLEPVAALRY